LSVIKVRRSRRVAIGAGGDAVLERAMRVHANFAEYVPFALVLLTLCALRGLPDVLLAALCAVLLLGRAVHAYGVSQDNEDFRLRVAGMMATFGVMGVSGLALVILAVIG
jgi:uncharacterized membrane protein YecN with MAPEG domain